MHSIRKFVGRGTLALGISALVVLAVAVQSGQAARFKDASQVASSAQVTQTSIHLNFAVSSPSPACTTAIGQLHAAFAADLDEDTSERAANATDTETGADATEDASERAAFKPLIAAVVAACGTTRTGHKAPIIAKTPACASALSALKAAFTADRAEDQAEFAAGTEGTAADQAEDQAELAHIQPLWAAVKAACWTGTSGTTTTFSTWWQRR